MGLASCGVEANDVIARANIGNPNARGGFRNSGACLPSLSAFQGWQGDLLPNRNANGSLLSISVSGRGNLVVDVCLEKNIKPLSNCDALPTTTSQHGFTGDDDRTANVGSNCNSGRSESSFALLPSR